MIDLLIKIALLICAAAGSTIAFFGETINKEGIGLIKRVTRLGWVSLSLLSFSLLFGVTNEFRQSAKSRKDVEAARLREVDAQEALKSRKRVEDDLKNANARLADTGAELSRARAKLDDMQSKLITAMYELTERIPRESDYAFVNGSDGTGTMPPTPLGMPHEGELFGVGILSSESHKPLVLYGGDEFEYHKLCGNGFFRTPDANPNTLLVAGKSEYPLAEENGVIRIAGPIGEPLIPELIGLTNRCMIKIVVRSADRTRMRSRFGPLLDSLKQLNGESKK
jgi:hypothetical protein